MIALWPVNALEVADEISDVCQSGADVIRHPLGEGHLPAVYFILLLRPAEGQTERVRHLGVDGLFEFRERIAQCIEYSIVWRREAQLFEYALGDMIYEQGAGVVDRGEQLHVPVSFLDDMAVFDRRVCFSVLFLSECLFKSCGQVIFDSHVRSQGKDDGFLCRET